MELSGRLTAVFGFMVFFAGSALSAQEVAPTRWRVNAVEIGIGGRVQAQLNTTTAESQPDLEMLLRRVRLEAQVRVNDLVSGKVQPDFAGDRVSVKDAFIRLEFSPQLQLLAGQAHRPFSLVELTSSTRMPPVERGARLRGVGVVDHYALVNGLRYSDRDVGLQIMGGFPDDRLRTTYRVGFFAGPLQGQVGSENSHQLAARVSIEPLERVRLGAALSRRDFARSAADRPSGWDLAPGTAFSLDLEYGSFSPGLHVVAEVAAGDADPFRGDSFLAAQSWLSYRTRALGRADGLEPLLRLSYGSVDPGDPLLADSGGLLLTPGVNVYLGGLNRMMLNYDLWTPAGGGGRDGGLKLQFQLAF